MAGVLVHEWFGNTGGSEKVLDVFAGMYPEADIFCLWDDSGQQDQDRLTESVLSKTPLRSNKALALPFMPLVWRNLKSARNYDWMLVSSHLFAHHARFEGVNSDIPKYVYTHTPARYIWEPELDERGNNLLFRSISLPLRMIDRSRAAEHISVAANSHFVAERVRRCWGLEAQVIHPPVDITRISSKANWSSELGHLDSELLEGLPNEFVLGASRFVSYKKLDVAIRAAELVGLPAVIAGSGAGEQALRARAAAASVPVFFVIEPTDALLFSLYQKCSVYVFPPIEDFGIMPVEAAAAGAPVVANRIGGTAETVLQGISGYLADMNDEKDLADAVEKAIQLDRSLIAPTATRFSQDTFRRKIENWMPLVARPSDSAGSL